MTAITTALETFTSTIEEVIRDMPTSGKKDFREKALEGFIQLFNNAWDKAKQAKKAPAPTPEVAPAPAPEAKKAPAPEVTPAPAPEVTPAPAFDVDSLVNNAVESINLEVVEALLESINGEGSKAKALTAFLEESGLQQTFNTLWDDVQAHAKAKKSSKK